MELPILLPPSLRYCTEASDDNALFELLRLSMADMALFLVAAVSDEVWGAQHRSFLARAIDLVTRRHFRDRLTAAYASLIASALREHHAAVDICINHDIQVEFGGVSYPVNSLLFTVDSIYFRRLVLSECSDRDVKRLRLRDTGIDPAFFQMYLLYCHTGDLPNLWQQTEEELHTLMIAAGYCQCLPIEKLAVQNYSRYITSENVCKILAIACQQGWRALVSECCTLINSLLLGFQCLEQKEGLGIELSNYDEQVFHTLSYIQHEITHLVCRRNVIDSPHFGLFVDQMTRLISLDISDTPVFSDAVMIMPERLEEIDLSQCPWLDAEFLENLIALCPRLTTLHLRDNTQLNQRFWHLLHKLQALHTLDLAGCSQIDDSDFRVLILACKHVSTFILKECSRISDRAFFELTRFCRNLRHLDVSHSNIGDTGLIEIAFRSSLRWLDIELCKHLSEKAIVEAVRHSPYLTYLDLTSCTINQKKIALLYQMRPSLRIIGP